ncbi:MAG: hypothetical protein WDM92_10500 [Caulobacteraceae bacterium]
MKIPNEAPRDEAWLWRAALWLAAGLTLARIAAIFLSPLELYPDEAQYWLWSRVLHWGYASQAAADRRLHPADHPGFRRGGVGAAVGPAGARGGDAGALSRGGGGLYGGPTALLGSALYGLMPAVQISSIFIATDAPLMLFLCLSLWAYVAMGQAATPGGGAGRRRGWAQRSAWRSWPSTRPSIS